jgi:circadian clock protein KaiC
LALKQFFAGRDCTVLMLDDCSGIDRRDGSDMQLESIAHGVIQLEHLANEYGAERRRLRVAKMRGVAFRGGYHDFTIRKGGLDVFPRLVAGEHHVDFADDDLPTGNVGLDELLRGGLPKGTSTLLVGPAGVGKSSVATQVAVSAAAKGLRTAFFVFDENFGTFQSRSRKLGLSVDEHLASGLMTIHQVDPAVLSPGEFASAVRRAVDGVDSAGKAASVVVIDSLNGYLNAMPEEKFLTIQLHEILAYLGKLGVVTVLSVTQSGMMGSGMRTPVDTTYLADNVILFRYFEDRGRVRRAISVAKKRNSAHEFTIRELSISEKGIEVGPPLTGFQGILTGVPVYVGEPGELARKSIDER